MSRTKKLICDICLYVLTNISIEVIHKFEMIVNNYYLSGKLGWSCLKNFRLNAFSFHCFQLNLPVMVKITKVVSSLILKLFWLEAWMERS